MSISILPDKVAPVRPPQDVDTSQPHPTSILSRTWSWLRGAGPTLIVIATLGSLAVWGHTNEWKLPKFSALVGENNAQQVDWCEEHGVPEAQCVECNPGLMPKGPDYGWCSEHGVQNCVLHHPELAQTKERPAVSQSDFDRAAAALQFERKRNNSVCKLYQQRIQFASIDAVNEAGVDVELVSREPISESILGNGEITYDATRYASISSRAPGTVWRVERNIGDRVRVGDLLAIVDAMAIGEAKGELIDALVEESLEQKNAERLSGLGGSVVAGRQVIEAEADYEKAQVRVLAAQQKLANLGLTVNLESVRAMSHEEQIERLRNLGFEELISATETSVIATANLLPIRAPMDGVVVRREVVPGEVVDTSRVLFQVADTSQMWLTLDIPLEKANALHLGLPVRFRPAGINELVGGELSWISTAVDPKTRMVQVRADLPNRDGRLRDETFGSGEVILREESKAIVVPNEAIHWEGCCQVVFVRDKHFFDSPESPKVFHIRTVRLGAKSGEHTEIVAGVLPGEIVASKGTDVLRAQLLKNNLGAGCCAE